MRWPRLPWSRKRYVLILARRGEPLVIEEFKARSLSEAKRIAQSIIEDLDPNQYPDLTRYRSFKVCPEDAESQADCERLRNPYFRPPKEESEKITPEDIEQATLAAVLQNVPNIVGQVLQMGMQMQAQVFNNILSMYNQMLGLGGKEEAPLDKLLKVGEQLIALWRAEKEAKESRPRSRPRILEGYK